MSLPSAPASPASPTSPLGGPAVTAPRSRRARFALRGLKSLGYGVVIALCLSGAFQRPLLATLAYSCPIAVACWFCIDLGRTLVAGWLHRHAAASSPEAANQWPGWPWMVGVIVVGTVIGFSVGNAVGNLITGHEAPGFMRGSWTQALALLLGSLIPGTAITYWFYSREALAAQRELVQTAQRQAAENQLKLLESQLEPHMLFNTLATLRVLIGIDPPRAQAMLDRLISFLRTTLSASRSTQHPLSAEFSRLSDYLALMQLRMGERLQAGFDLPAALAGVPVPPLLLQPLVENAITHGLEPKVGGGRIDISAAREGDELVLRVRDTGVGLSDAISQGTRFGLVQVRERLATLYGERASLVLADAASAGGGHVAGAGNGNGNGAGEGAVERTGDGALATVRLPMPA